MPEVALGCIEIDRGASDKPSNVYTFIVLAIWRNTKYDLCNAIYRFKQPKQTWNDSILKCFSAQMEIDGSINSWRETKQTNIKIQLMAGVLRIFLAVAAVNKKDKWFLALPIAKDHQ